MARSMLSPDSLLSLREVLRVRRELPAAEVTQLLQGLPEMLDNEDSGSSGSLINEVSVRFDGPPAGGIAEVARRPIKSWPPFHLHVEGQAEQDAGATIVGGISLFASSPVARLAALMYELLGGRIRDEELRRNYSPLAELDETANLLLKKALSRRGFADCVTFWREWLGIIDPGALAHPEREKEKERAEAFHIPDAFLAAGQPGETLELTPVDKPAVPTRLVARSIFRIGRSRRLSDLPTRSSTDSGVGESIKELSRVHVVAERVDSGFGFRDGNGEHASSNGTMWNQEPLSHEAPTPITAPGMLVLSPTSCRFRLEVLPFPASRAARLEIDNFTDWRGAAAPAADLPSKFGALVFRHPRGAMVVRQTLWLLTAVGVEVLSTGELVWNEENNASHAFLHRAGHFWIVNLAAAQPVRVAETALAPGEIAPISGGQVIELGGVPFQTCIM